MIKSVDEIKAIGHRVVHGGEKFSASTLLNDEKIAELEDLIHKQTEIIHKIEA